MKLYHVLNNAFYSTKENYNYFRFVYPPSYEIIKKSIFLASVFLILQLGWAQEVMAASGGEALGFGGSGSYIGGQEFYKTCTGIAAAVSQGVQQSFDF